MEALSKLVELNTKISNTTQIAYWQNYILRAEKSASKKEKTNRTKLIASSAALSLAKTMKQDFDNIKLTLPLNTSLKKKKSVMQKAVKLYGRASSYGISETATESTHTIGEIYLAFSKALINSEKPKNLNKDELEQYQILLEDKAFAFEENAIGFFETNLAHSKEGVSNSYITNSLKRLKEVFPTRYARKLKLDDYVNVIH